MPGFSPKTPGQTYTMCDALQPFLPIYAAEIVEVTLGQGVKLTEEERDAVTRHLLVCPTCQKCHENLKDGFVSAGACLIGIFVQRSGFGRC